MTLVPNMEGISSRFDDPYFTQVVEPDEEKFLDRDAPGKGVIAVFSGQSESIIEPET